MRNNKLSNKVPNIYDSQFSELESWARLTETKMRMLGASKRKLRLCNFTKNIVPSPAAMRISFEAMLIPYNLSLLQICSLSMFIEHNSLIKKH